MKLHYVSRDQLNNKSFSVTHHKMRSLFKLWHYHPELELVLTVSSRGTRFVGDSIKKFESGDVVLIGKDLPHMWLNDDDYFKEDSDLIAEDYVVHFKEHFLGKEFLSIDEMKPISDLLNRSQFGIKFLNLTDEFRQKIRELNSKTDFERVISLLSILHELATHEDYQLLASVGYINPSHQPTHSKSYKIYEYIFQNFSTQISQDDVARIADMNTAAFSRFFKRTNNKTFSKYLNEVRIGYACKLLLENSKSISSICYESGFNNISNFNRQFKAIKDISPSNYKKKYYSTPKTKS